MSGYDLQIENLWGDEDADPGCLDISGKTWPGDLFSSQLFFLVLHIENMDHVRDLIERISVYRQLRRRSDIVRTQLIPMAVANGTPIGQTFYDLTKTYFEGDVRAGQLVEADDIALLAESGKSADQFETTIEEITAVPTHRMHTSGFESLHPRYIRGISERLFSVIDESRQRRRRGAIDLVFLVIVDFCLRLAHFARDGTGRTCEDVLVLLAAETGRTMTFSPTGYRGALEGNGYPLLYRSFAQKIFFREAVANFFRHLGLPVPDAIPFEFNNLASVLGEIGGSDSRNRADWPDGMGPTIENIRNDIAEDPVDDSELFLPSRIYRHYAEFLAGEMIFLTMCLEAPAKYLQILKERYPSSLSSGLHSLAYGLGRSYLPIADDIGDACDRAISLIEAVRRGQLRRGDPQLETAVAGVEIEDTKTGALFRQELFLYLTLEERAAINFGFPRGGSGAQLEELIWAGASKVRGQNTSPA